MPAGDCVPDQSHGAPLLQNFKRDRLPRLVLLDPPKHAQPILSSRRVCVRPIVLPKSVYIGLHGVEVVASPRLRSWSRCSALVPTPGARFFGFPRPDLAIPPATFGLAPIIFVLKWLMEKCAYWLRCRAGWTGTGTTRGAP